MSSDLNKKYKKPKQLTPTTTSPGTSTSRATDDSVDRTPPPQPLCPLLAKDSEWADILQTPQTDAPRSTTNISDEEEVLQLVDSEDGPQMKPLAIMFPGLLDKDPQTLEGMLNKAMSTTEVTRHLVNLGQKANFTFMKKADRLIPPDKQWMESLTENSNSYCSVDSGLLSKQIFWKIGISSDYEADSEVAEGDLKGKKVRRRRKHLLKTILANTNEFSAHELEETDEGNNTLVEEKPSTSTDKKKI